MGAGSGVAAVGPRAGEQVVDPVDGDHRHQHEERHDAQPTAWTSWAVVGVVPRRPVVVATGEPPAFVLGIRPLHLAVLEQSTQVGFTGGALALLRGRFREAGRGDEALVEGQVGERVVARVVSRSARAAVRTGRDAVVVGRVTHTRIVPSATTCRSSPDHAGQLGVMSAAIASSMIATNVAGSVPRETFATFATMTRSSTRLRDW